MHLCHIIKWYKNIFTDSYCKIGIIRAALLAKKAVLWYNIKVGDIVSAPMIKNSAIIKGFSANGKHLFGRKRYGKEYFGQYHD